jgi:hypothetical protein
MRAVRALLRYQAVTLAQTLRHPAAILRLGGLAILVWLAFSMSDGASATLAFVGAMTAVLVGMTRTFESLDTIRWVVPIRREHAVRAHFGFWLMVLSPLSLIVAIGRSQDVVGAAILYLHLELVVVAAAAIVIFYQRITRRGVGAVAMLAGIVVGSVLVWPVAWSFYLAWSGRAESLLLITVVAGVCWALGVPSFLREELLPTAAGKAVERRRSRADGEEPAVARSPVATVLRGAYPPVWIAVWIALGGVLPLLFAWTTIFAIYAPFAGSSVAGFALQSWRWLAATPIDRDRAFRILFGPTLAFVLVVTGARLVFIETTVDRSAFFRDYRYDSFVTRGPATLGLPDVLDIGPDGNRYLPPDLQVVAGRVHEHLRTEYGLPVSEERIEADMRPAWPRHPTAGRTDEDQTAVLDAMERVRVDLADDIAGATRRRDFAIAAGLVLAFLVMLRVQFAGPRLGVFLVTLVQIPLATLALFGRERLPFAAKADKLYAAMTGGSSTAHWLALVVACAFAVFLWRSARAAFRRIDLLDLPSNPPAWMRS